MPSSPSLNPNYLPGSYEERNDQAHHLFNQGELDQAAAICRRIIERISHLPERRRADGSALHTVLMEASILLAEIHAKQADWPALDDLCMRAQVRHPVYAQRWAIEPFMLRIRYGQPQAGIRGLQALADGEPDSFYLWRTLAQAAVDAADLDLALDASDHAQRVMTGEEDVDDIAPYHIVRFRLFKWRGQWYEAAREWRSACLLDNEMEELRDEVVRMFLAAGLYDDALNYVDDEVLGAMVANYYRGWVAHRRGDQVRARHLWRKIVESDPDEEDNPPVRAIAYCYLRQSDAALAAMMDYIGNGGAVDVPESMTLALAWAMHGDVDAARSNLQMAAKRAATEAGSGPLLPALDWIDFEQLVVDDAIKAELRPFFEPPKASPLVRLQES
jgi:tetratricopeptide (TPR) repeat protein